MKKIFSFILGLCLLGGFIEPSCSPFTKRTIEAGWFFKEDATVLFRGYEVVIPAGSCVVPLGQNFHSGARSYTFPLGSKTSTHILLETSGGDQPFGPRIRYISPDTPLYAFSVVFPQID